MPRISIIVQSVDIFIQREVNPKMCSYTVQFILQCLITTPRLELKSFFFLMGKKQYNKSKALQRSVPKYTGSIQRAPKKHLKKEQGTQVEIN